MTLAVCFIVTCCDCVSIPLTLADITLVYENLVYLLDDLPSLRTLELQSCFNLMKMPVVSWSCSSSERMYVKVDTFYLLLILYALRTSMQ